MVELASFNKLVIKTANIIEQFNSMREDKSRMESLIVKKRRENQEIKKKLEKILKERDIIKKKLDGIIEKIDALDL